MMKTTLKFESARALPMILALVLIYALSSIAASHSFADLAAGALPMRGGPPGLREPAFGGPGGKGGPLGITGADKFRATSN